MAERVDKMPPRMGGSKYPWDEWLDGSVWELIRGKDFEPATGSFRSAVEHAAFTRRLKVQIRVRGDRVYIQAGRDRV